MKLYRRRDALDDLFEGLFVALVVLGGLLSIVFGLYKKLGPKFYIFIGSFPITGIIGYIVGGIIAKKEIENMSDSEQYSEYHSKFLDRQMGRTSIERYLGREETFDLDKEKKMDLRRTKWYGVYIGVGFSFVIWMLFYFFTEVFYKELIAVWK